MSCTKPPIIGRKYYQILGIEQNATSEEIKKAYKLKAKELHPDVNKGRDTTVAFQMLQEAYSVLGSPERRALYDFGDEVRAKSSETHATEADFDPFPCSSCGKISAQPRYLHYYYVLSFVLFSYRKDASGVFCPDCASKKLLWSSFITGCIGWIGFPWGIIWSLRALVCNLLGGEKPREVNAFVLTNQALHFHKTGNQDLAACVFADALSFAKRAKESETVSQCKRVIDHFNRAGVKKHIKSKWNGISKPRLFAFSGFAVPALIWSIIFLAATRADLMDELSQAEGAVNRTAPEMVDSETRLDGAKAGPGKRFTYRYTVMTLVGANDRLAFEQKAVPKIRNSIITAKEFRPFFKRGVTLAFEYHTADGSIFDEIVVKPEEAVPE